MHDHPHDDHPHHHHGHGHRHPHDHNHGPGVAQWEQPHRTEAATQAVRSAPEADFDLVEQAFVEGFGRAPDVPSFLRLAGLPFVGAEASGRRLYLLRVVLDHTVDVGSLSPGPGGGAMRYAPLPARLASNRRRLALVYQDGPEQRRLGLAEARALRDCVAEPEAALMVLQD